MEEPQLKRTVGIGEATFTLVGFVIGMAPFLVPGELAPSTGPGLFISFLLAGALAVLSCFVAAQIGGLFPMSGAGYVGASCVLSPFLGFLLVWMIMMTMVVGMPILGFGFAKYLAYFAPGLPQPLVAALAIAGFGAINLAGVKATTAIQAVLVSVLLIILVIFGVGGLAHCKPELMTPLMPNGIKPILIAAIPAYYAYGGFMVIVEMGDEIKNPARTVPISLALSFAIVLVIYVMTAVAFTGLLPWDGLAGMPAPLVNASEVFLPKWFSNFIALSALLGAGVCINGWFMTQTRDIYALARDRVLPAALAHVNAKRGEPDAAIVFAIAISVCGVFLGASIQEYAVMVVLAMTLIQVFAGLVIILAPRKMPERYEKSAIKLGRAGVWFFGISFMLFSALFGALGASESPKAAKVFAIMLAVGSAYYFLRRRALKASGVSIEDLLKKDLARLR